MPDKETAYREYVTTKIDRDLLPNVKAAAAFAGKAVMDWLSDLANEASARETGRKPVKRKPPRPRDK